LDRARDLGARLVIAAAIPSGSHTPRKRRSRRAPEPEGHIPLVLHGDSIGCAFEVVGAVKAHGQWGRVDEADVLLREQAATLGANAIINVSYADNILRNAWRHPIHTSHGRCIVMLARGTAVTTSSSGGETRSHPNAGFTRR
jgi:hypothetical protein